MFEAREAAASFARTDQDVPKAPGERRLPAVPWLLAGRDAAALAARAGQLCDVLGNDPGLDLADAAWSLVFPEPEPGPEPGLRAAVVATDRDDLLAGLTALHEGRGRAGLLTATPDPTARAAFVFTGQGRPAPGMGSGLHAAFPAFADAFDQVCGELDVHLSGFDQDLATVIAGRGGESPVDAPGSLLDQTMWAQAGLFALEVSLFRLLQSWGVRPDHLAGHSIGELAAAHVAGVWSLPDACAVVAARGRLMQALPRDGLMMAVQAGEEEVAPVLLGYPRAAIAAVNGPDAVVISGDLGDVAGAAGELAVAGIKTRRLRVSHAFHSPLMEPMLADFAVVTESVRYRAPTIPVVSALTGRAVTTELTDPTYWVRHVRDPVRFADVVAVLRDAGVRTFVEIGPDGVLSSMSAPPGAADRSTETWLPALRRGRDEARTAISAVASLHAHGRSVDWAGFYAGTGARRIDLPGTGDGRLLNEVP